VIESTKSLQHFLLTDFTNEKMDSNAYSIKLDPNKEERLHFTSIVDIKNSFNPINDTLFDSLISSMIDTNKFKLFFV